MKPIYLDRVGSDMEVFLRDMHTGKPVPSCGLIGGTKQEPRPVLDEEGFAVQEDNVMLEFNIPAAKDVTGFVSSFAKILEHINAEVNSKGMMIDISPSMQFLPEDLTSPQAFHIGCEPDFNAYRDVTRRVTLEEMGVRRCAGGHVHVSFFTEPDEEINFDGSPEKEQRVELVKGLDLFLALPSLFLDDDDVRRSLYGKPGMYRPKVYGIEYRSLSNFWIKKESLIEWVYQQIPKAIKFLNDGGRAPNHLENIIATDDKESAKTLMKYFGVRLPQEYQNDLINTFG